MHARSEEEKRFDEGLTGLQGLDLIRDETLKAPAGAAEGPAHREQSPPTTSPLSPPRLFEASMPLDVMSLLASQLEGHAWAVGDKSASERHEDGHAVSIIFATIASTLLVVLFYIAGPLYSLLTRSLKTGARSQGHVSVAHPESWDDKTKPPAQDSAMAVDTATKPEGPTGDFEGDINVSNDLPTEQQLKRAAEHPVLDPEGKTHTFKSLSSPEDGSRVLVIFIRHFLCGVGALCMVFICDPIHLPLLTSVV